MRSWVYGIHNDSGLGSHPRHSPEQRLGMLRQGQTQEAKNDYWRDIKETHVGLPFHVKHSAKKLVGIRCP